MVGTYNRPMNPPRWNLSVVVFLILVKTTLFASIVASSSSTHPISTHSHYSSKVWGTTRRSTTSRRDSSSSFQRSTPTIFGHATTRRSSLSGGLDFLVAPRSEAEALPLSSSSALSPLRVVQPCRSIGNTLLRGAFLRIASDLSGGTPLEGIKTRVTLTTENSIEATRNIVRTGGIGALWTGSSSRTVEGALIGAVFMLGSVLTKSQLKKLGAPPTVAALAGGLVGGVAQAVIMTPAGLIFTALNNQQHKGSTTAKTKKETTLGIVSRVISEKGVRGMFAGGQAMCIRQATNWASRSGFTEIARSTLHLSQYGLLGEIAAGAIGGVGSCWNTPIETIRVYTQRDVSQGKPPKPMNVYWDEIVTANGYPGLFRGVTPRAVQAIWQTVFLVVVPNLMGI